MSNMFCSLIVCALLFTARTYSLPSLLRLTPYAPTPATCPASGLSREANGLSAPEEEYRRSRSIVANKALMDYFHLLSDHLEEPFDLANIEFPALGLASSGGGIGSMLNGAGAIQAMDARDKTVSDKGSNISGLYQAVTYHSGTSTGAWLVAALAGNEDSTIGSLLSDLWMAGFDDPSFIPTMQHRLPAMYAAFNLDLVAKSTAGYTPTLVDTLGRVIASHVLKGDESHQTLSGIANSSAFLDHRGPFPVITALNVDPRKNISGCIHADLRSPQYEFHPFEFGSWDSGIRSFSKTAFMGSETMAGFALSPNTCIQGFDSLGFLVAASTGRFNDYCSAIPASNRFMGQLGNLYNDIIGMTGMVHGLSPRDEYAIIPGPFASTTNMGSLSLVDGSQGGESLPLWPLLVDARNISVIIALDFSTSAQDFLPDGSSLYNTYLRAQQLGVWRMPTTPKPSSLADEGSIKSPKFFGCDDPDKALIIYIPNSAHILGTNAPDWQLQFDSTMINQLIENGNLVATMKGLDQWPVCIACAIYSKSSNSNRMPSMCVECFGRFCWRG